MNLQVIKSPTSNILGLREVLVDSIVKDTKNINVEILKEELYQSLSNIDRTNSYNGFALSRGQNSIDIAITDNISSLIDMVYSYIEDYIHDIKMSEKGDLSTYTTGELDRIQKKLEHEGLNDIYTKVYKKILPLLEYGGIVPVIECDTIRECEILDVDLHEDTFYNDLSFMIIPKGNRILY